MTLPRLHIDFETRSACNLKAAGQFRYAEHHTTTVTLLAYQFHGDLVRQWKPGEPFPRDVAEHVAAGGVCVQHNAGFERRIWNFTLPRLVPGLPAMRAEQQSCTLARALVIGLPRDLKTLAKVLGCRNQKMELATTLFNKATSYDGQGLPWALSAEETGFFEEYNKLDVLVEAEVDALLPELSEQERRVWLLDQLINDRGIPIDLPSIVAMQALAGDAVAEANAEIRKVTAGAVQKVTEAGRLKTYLQGRGYDPNGASEFELNLIDFSEDPAAKRAVELRLGFGKSSIAKLPRMLGCVASDGRLHDQYGYSVAGTRRWAAQIVQFQNLPRYDEEKDKFRLDTLYALLERFGTDTASVSGGLRLMTGEPMLDTVSRSLRKLIKASPGCELFGGDLSNVEGRGNAWLAGQDDKLEAFRDYDRGDGPDLYKVAYATAFSVPVDTLEKKQRQLGKIMELGGGYGGGVGAYLKFAELQGLNLAEMAAAVKEAVDAADWKDVLASFPSARDKHGLEAPIWTAIKILVRNFRTANDKIARSWYAYKDAIVVAVENPGMRAEAKGVRGVSYLFDGQFLWCGLPSGGLLAYFQPEIVLERSDSLLWADGLTEDADTYYPHEIADFVSLGLAELARGLERKGIRFWGKEKGMWASKRLYGGLCCENVTQSLCRDGLAYEKMLPIEASGFPIVCHTHDDIVSEVPSGSDFGHFERLFNAPLSFAPELPIAADCWRGPRYGG